jgi:hypothetical protein
MSSRGWRQNEQMAVPMLETIELPAYTKEKYPVRVAADYNRPGAARGERIIEKKAK